jgi:hypothetical protein
MGTSDIIWRVNRRPRFTVLEFGEYMAADEGPRETIERDAKYEKLARSISYVPVEQCVASFLASPTRDRVILANGRDLLDARKLATTDPKKRNQIELQIAALDAFERQLNRLEIAGLTAELPSRQQPKLALEGVNISVYPSVWLTKRRSRGADLAGGFLVDFAKGEPIKTDAAKAKAMKAMTHAACVLHMQVQALRCSNGEKASAEHCWVYHVVRDELIIAPSGYATPLRNMKALCRSLAKRWDDIPPPSSFDPSRARYRDH